MRTVDRNRRVSESVKYTVSVTIVTSAPIVLPNNHRKLALEQKSKMESRVRKNTVKLVCSSGSKTPAHLEVLKFALQHLKVPPADLHSVYRDENENRFYLKFIDEAKFASFMRGLEEAYTFPYDDGTVTRAHLEMASSIFRYVRIFSLPPEIDDKDIALVLGQFGTIRQQVRERFAAAHGVNIYTGVRGVHMEVAKEIPAHVYIGHFRARIFYDGLKNKCFLCKGEGHVKAECPRSVTGNNSDGGNSSNGGSRRSNGDNGGSTVGNGRPTGGASYANVAALGEAANCESPTASVTQSHRISNATEEQPAQATIDPTPAPPTIGNVPQEASAVGDDNASVGHDVTKSGDLPGSTDPNPADKQTNDEMEVDEKKTALKRTMLSSSDDDSLATKEAPFVVVQQRKGKTDVKKGKLEEPLPTAALEKRSLSKSRSTAASVPKVVPNTTRRTK